MQRRLDYDYLMKETGRTYNTINKYYHKLGRMPTVEELMSVKIGRKRKCEIENDEQISTKELAKKFNVTINIIYYLENKLGRVPTEEDILNRRKRK